MSRCILTSVKILRIFKHFFIDFLKFTFVTVDMKRSVYIAVSRSLPMIKFPDKIKELMHSHMLIGERVGMTYFTDHTLMKEIRMRVNIARSFYTIICLSYPHSI